jgi:hypothetical protein
VSTAVHATVYMFLHNLLNVKVQIANKMGLQKKFTKNPFFETEMHKETKLTRKPRLPSTKIFIQH